jgi:GNAT superfamily N-acetyltransferase
MVAGVEAEGRVDGVDREMLHGWVAARSMARGLAPPVADHGGWRVDTASPEEVRRYIFASADEPVRALARSITVPRVRLKVCVERQALAALLPPGWMFEDGAFVMTGPVPAAARVPPGYRIARHDAAGVRHVRVMADDGAVAASGHGATARGVFAYDRIVTDAAHRRRGLGRVVMATLGEAAFAGDAHMLVATAMGRALYESLGWETVSPYTTAVIPD